MNFNQSISKELLTKSIDYAKSIITMEDKLRKEKLRDERRSYVTCNNIQSQSSIPVNYFYLIKPMSVLKKDNSDFDVTMGSYDRANVSEWVSRALFNKTTN